jgi:xanthine/uracil permease
MILISGLIAGPGIDQLKKNRLDLLNQKKYCDTLSLSLVIVKGPGDLFISLGAFSSAGIGLAAIIGVIIYPVFSENVKSSGGLNN